MTGIRPDRVLRGWHRKSRSREKDAKGPAQGEAWQDADRAVSALYRAHHCSLTGIAALLASDGAKAEEIVREGLTALREASPRLRNGDRALSYLRRAVVTGARSQRESPAVRPPSVATLGQPGSPWILLRDALPYLPALQREALVLKYYAGWPDRQIAAAMGISRPALRTHVQRGTSAVRPALALARERT